MVLSLSLSQRKCHWLTPFQTNFSLRVILNIWDQYFTFSSSKVKTEMNSLWNQQFFKKKVIIFLFCLNFRCTTLIKLIETYETSWYAFSKITLKTGVSDFYLYLFLGCQSMCVLLKYCLFHDVIQFPTVDNPQSFIIKMTANSLFTSRRLYTQCMYTCINT